MVTASQLEELRFLKAIFADEILIRDVHLSQLVNDEESFAFTCQDQSLTTTDSSNVAVSFQLNLDLNAMQNAPGENESLHLHCTLSSEYPNVPARVQALTGILSTALLDSLNSILLQRLGNSESIYDAAMFAKQWTVEQMAHVALSQSADSLNPSATSATSGSNTLSRRFFWTHHTRRKQLLIYKWAKELKISGRLTVSKPGYIFVEGAMGDMKEFTRRNMAEKWKEIRMTWEEDVVVETEQHVDTKRLFPDGLKEVSIKQFISDLRERDRVDALKTGTRGAVIS